MNVFRVGIDCGDRTYISVLHLNMSEFCVYDTQIKVLDNN